MHNRRDYIESMFFNNGTTNRIDFRNVEVEREIRESAKTVQVKVKPDHTRLKPPTLKNVHTLSDWKGEATPFSLMHFRKDIVRTNPHKTLETHIKEIQEKVSNNEDEQIRLKRPRVIMTPAVSVDDIADPRVRGILLDDMYSSTFRHGYKRPVESMHAKAPLPLRLAPSNPIRFAKLAPPFVSPEWRLESAKWDKEQLRALCVPTKEFWVRRDLRKYL